MILGVFMQDVFHPSGQNKKTLHKPEVFTFIKSLKLVNRVARFLKNSQLNYNSKPTQDLKLAQRVQALDK